MGISRSFSDYLGLMLGKPHIRQNNLKISLKFPCLGLSPIINSIILTHETEFVLFFFTGSGKFGLAHGLRQLACDAISDLNVYKRHFTHQLYNEKLRMMFGVGRHK